MAMIRTFTMIAALMAGSAARAEPPKAPAADKKADKPASDDKASRRESLSEATAQRYVVFFDKLVGIAAAKKDDCTRMASAINAHVDAHQPLLKEIAEAKAQNKEAPQSLKDHIAQKTRDELQPALAKCAQDKAVMAAFMRIRPTARMK